MRNGEPASHSWFKLFTFKVKRLCDLCGRPSAFSAVKSFSQSSSDKLKHEIRGALC